jgi:hypothetical protein
VSSSQRKEERRRAREERERQLRAAERRRRMLGYGAAGLLVIAVIVVLGLVVAGGGDDGGDGSADTIFPEGGSVPDQQVTDLREAADAAGCELIDTPSRSRDDRLHTDSTDQRVRYRGNPPTLGRHWPPGFQAEDGVYGESPADEALVHTMEHGRVIIWAKPSLSERVRSTLRALFDEDSYQLVLTPRRDMPYEVAATAWNGEPGPAGTGRTLGCPAWSEQAVDAIRAFRDEHRSRGPEPVP